MSVGSKTNVVSAFGALSRTSFISAVGESRTRLALVDTIRALAATIIVAHHFSSYPPLANAASPIAGPLINLFHDYGRVAQVFIVISGYMLAGSLSHRTWDRQRVGRFIVQRYFRLAIPYLAATVLAIGACAIGRDWIDESVVGGLPTLEQLLAHMMFLQDLLGYESLSAGLWFVCISFQLTLIYVAGLLVRDIAARRAVSAAGARWSAWANTLGWLLAGASLFYFNRDSSWENCALYFFGQFFLGVLVHHALQNSRSEKSFAIYVLVIAAALAFEWRSRLALALATGVMLYIGGKIGATYHWRSNRLVDFMGRTSYSLFLIHFPVLVVIATLWVRQEWTSPPAAIAGLVVAYLVSIAAAALFYRFIEAPAARLSRRFA